MSLALVPVLTVAHPSRQRFTREQARRMAKLGLIAGRYELVHGEIIGTVGQNPPRAGTFRKLQPWLSTIIALVLIRLQLPVEVAIEDRNRSEPQPDAVVLASDLADCDFRHPRGNEIVLLVGDRRRIGRLRSVIQGVVVASCRRAGVLRAGLNRRARVVHRAPEQGRYSDVRGYGADACLAEAPGRNGRDGRQSLAVRSFRIVWPQRRPMPGK